VNWPYSPRDVLLPTTAPKPSNSANELNGNGASNSSNSSSNRGVSNGGVGGTGADTDEPFWRMNPVFESHILNLDNWSLGPAFSEHFPQWVGTVRIKESGLGVGRIVV
jgi:hypothetical protein